MNDGSPSLKRELGLFDSTMIVAGSMIGSGIFIVSADIARTVGSTGWLLVVWALAGAATMIAALSYGELAAMMPKAGGQYVYLREAFNPLTGFLYGWTLFLVIQTGTIAAVAVAFAKYAAILFPAFSEANVLAQLGPLRISAGQALAILLICSLTGLNLRGLRGGKAVQNLFTSAKLLALLGLIAVGLTIGRNAAAISANLSGFWAGNRVRLDAIDMGGMPPTLPLVGLAILPALGVAMVGSLFSSDAWNNVTFTAGEVSNPERNLPLSLVLGTGIVTALYLLANLSYLSVLPLKGSPQGATVLERGIQFAAQDRVAAATVQAIFGSWGSGLMAALIMVSAFGCANGMILAGGRVYYAMAQDGLFFKRASILNKNAVPGAALILQAAWTSLLCLSGTYSELLDYVVFAVLVFYILTIWGLFRLRRAKPTAPRPYRAWGYPVMPALYIVAAALICADLLVLKPAQAWPGLGIVLTGVPVYFLWRRKPQN